MSEHKQIENIEISMRPHASLCIEQRHADQDILELALVGQINFDGASVIQECLNEQYQHFEPKQLVLDCEALKFVDSQGLTVFLTLYRACQSKGGKLALKNPSESFRKLLSMTRLDKIIAIL